jgi:hypothetical protein
VPAVAAGIVLSAVAGLPVPLPVAGSPTLAPPLPAPAPVVAAPGICEEEPKLFSLR